MELSIFSIGDVQRDTITGGLGSTAAAIRLGSADDPVGVRFFQMDVGQLPQRDFLRSIELLGTKLKPLVDAELGSKQEAAVVH